MLTADLTVITGIVQNQMDNFTDKFLPSISASAVPGLGLLCSITASFLFSVAINGELGLHPGLVH